MHSPTHSPMHSPVHSPPVLARAESGAEGENKGGREHARTPLTWVASL